MATEQERALSSRLMLQPRILDLLTEQTMQRLLAELETSGTPPAANGETALGEPKPDGVRVTLIGTQAHGFITRDFPRAHGWTIGSDPQVLALWEPTAPGETERPALAVFPWGHVFSVEAMTQE